MILEITYIHVYCMNILAIQVYLFLQFCKKVLRDGTESFVPCTKQMEIFTKTHIFIYKVF